MCGTKRLAEAASARIVAVWLVLVSVVNAQTARENAQSAEAARERSRQAIERAVSRVHDEVERARRVASSRPIDVARERVMKARTQAFGTNISDLRITQVTLECEAPVCKGRLETLKRLTALEEGEPFAFEKAQRATERLFKTGLFETIDVEPRVTEQGIALTLRLVGAVRVQQIRYEGLSPPPFREEFQRLSIYREGQPFRAMDRGEDHVEWWLEGEAFSAWSGARESARDLAAVTSDELRARYVREQDRVKAQLQSFKELLARDGFFEASVGLVARRDTSDPYQVRLTIIIEKGEAQKICDLGIRGLRQMSYTEARALLFKERPLWTRYIGFIRPVYTERMLRAGQEALINEYRELGYYQARVLDKRVNEMNRECVQVLFDISEGPRWRTIFRGNRIFSSEDLEQALVFRNTGYVDNKAIRDAEEQLEQLHATRGYPFARVECEEERKDRFDRIIRCYVEEGPRKEIRAIEFVSDRKDEPLSAARISQELTPESLQEIMGTRPFGLFETGGFLQLEELMADLGRIEARYQEQGYLWAQVVGFTIEYVDDTGLKVVIAIHEGARARVAKTSILKQERVIESLRGSTADDALRQKLTMLPDLPVTLVQVRADNSRLTQHYAALGYPMAAVQTTCDLGPQKDVEGTEGVAQSDEVESEQNEESLVGCDLPQVPTGCVIRDIQELKNEHCDWEGDVNQGLSGYCARVLTSRPECLFDPETMHSDFSIAHRIAPGPFVTVDAVWLSGNHETRDSLLLGEMKLEAGDRLDVKRLLEGQAGMRSLSLFDSVSVEAVGLDDAALVQPRSKAVLMVSVEEGEYRYFDLSVGVQGRDLLDTTRRRMLLTSELEYTNRNWRGLAQRLQPRLLAAIDTLQAGRLSLGLASDAVDPTTAQNDFDYLLGAELVYNNPRFMRSSLGVEKLLLTVAPYYLIDLIGVTLNNLLREEVGTRAEVRKELTELLERLFVTFGLQGKVIATRTPESLALTSEGERLFSPRRTVGKFYLDTTLDRRDSPLNPTRGYFLQFSPQLVSGDALGADAGDALTDAFFKVTLGGSGYLALGEDLVLAQSLRFGQIIPLFGRRRPIPQDERYILGGVSSLRGVPEAGITTQVVSYRDVLRGGEFVINSNSELRYPLLESYGFFGATFFDVGVLADCFEDKNSSNAISCYEDAFPASAPLSKVRMAAGVGLRYLVGDQIPLLLDYAMLLDRRPGERFGYLHFNVGYTF